MDQADQPQNRRKTLDEVREERRIERIEAVQDPELRQELCDRIKERDKSLGQMREVQGEKRPEYVHDIGTQRRTSGLPLSTAAVEVDKQYHGWIKGEADRHNKHIDGKLREYEGFDLAKFNSERYVKDAVYRQVINEERKELNRSLTQTNTQSPKQNAPEAIDWHRYIKEPPYREEMDARQREAREEQKQQHLAQHRLPAQNHKPG